MEVQKKNFLLNKHYQTLNICIHTGKFLFRARGRKPSSRRTDIVWHVVSSVWSYCLTMHSARSLWALFALAGWPSHQLPSLGTPFQLPLPHVVFSLYFYFRSNIRSFLCVFFLKGAERVWMSMCKSGCGRRVYTSCSEQAASNSAVAIAHVD